MGTNIFLATILDTVTASGKWPRHAFHVFYEHKGPEHYARVGMSDLLVGIDEACDTNGSRAILAALNRVNDRQEQIRTQLVQRVKELRDYAQAHLADALADVTMRGYTREQGKS